MKEVYNNSYTMYSETMRNARLLAREAIIMFNFGETFAIVARVVVINYIVC